MKSVLALLLVCLAVAQTRADNDFDEIFDMTLDELAELKSECFNTTGNDDAFNNFIREKDVAKTCVASKFNLEDFATDLGVSAGLGISSTFIIKYCPVFNATAKCLSQLLDSLLPCSIEEDQEEAKQLGAVLKEVLNLFCSNGGRNLADFMEAKGVDCLFENSDSLSECFEKATDGIDFEDVELSYAECQSIVDIKNCTITAMDGCAKPKASEQIEEFFKSLYAISPCASKEKPETTTINSKEDVVTAEKEIVVSEITNNEV